MNVNDFSSKLVGGGVRPHLFEVNGSIGTVDLGGLGQSSIPFLVKAAQLPASTLGLIEVPYRGRKVKIPGDRTFADWSVTVLNDEDYLIRNAFERWSNAINGMVENITAGDTRTYMKDGRVDQLAKDGSVIRTYVIRDMFPTTVAAIPLSYDTTDTIQEFDVTLAYQYFEVESPTGVTT